MSEKDSKKESFPSLKWEKKPSPVEDNLIKEKPFTGKLNDPNVPMRRKNRVLNDGKDWFDTHPDA
tara:strand:+ start:268 stop:462 length:195 start_codon:yes stop_codon:yes gene_type:complete